MDCIYCSASTPLPERMSGLARVQSSRSGEVFTSVVQCALVCSPLRLLRLKTHTNTHTCTESNESFCKGSYCLLLSTIHACTLILYQSKLDQSVVVVFFTNDTLQIVQKAPQSTSIYTGRYSSVE